METILNTTETATIAEIPAFRIVVAYEDFVSGIRSKDMAERLTARLKSEYLINSDLWKFDFLMGRLLWEQAVAAASEADLIIISANAATELPPHAKAWMKSWSAQKSDRRAVLIALLQQEDEIPGEPSPLCIYLRQIAYEADMDFICKTGYGGKLDFEYTVGAIQSQPENVQMAIDGVLHEDGAGRGWSIAE
jgi:hypothetical protein